MMSGVTLDWSSAEVREGGLDVRLHGELPRGWKEGFDRTVALLPGGEWGKVKLKKGRIHVDDIPEGCEERLSHFLESVVLQANASAQPEEAESGDQDTAGDDELSDLNEAMTERFRAFAGDTKTQER